MNVWHGMPVCNDAGIAVGSVTDVSFYGRRCEITLPAGRFVIPTPTSTGATEVRLPGGLFALRRDGDALRLFPLPDRNDYANFSSNPTLTRMLGEEVAVGRSNDLPANLGTIKLVMDAGYGSPRFSPCLQHWVRPAWATGPWVSDKLLPAARSPGMTVVVQWDTGDLSIFKIQSLLALASEAAALVPEWFALRRVVRRVLRFADPAYGEPDATDFVPPRPVPAEVLPDEEI